METVLSENQAHFGSRLRNTMNQAGMTTEALVRACRSQLEIRKGMTTEEAKTHSPTLETIERMLCGQSFPQPEVVDTLAGALNVTPEVLWPKGK